jgi:hypothetical protein
MTYRGYTIAPRINTAMCGKPTVYDILDGDRPVKRTFATVEMARHYIDVALKGADNERHE